MFQLAEDSISKENLLKKFNEARQNRLKVEKQAEELKKKLSCLKLKEDLSQKRIKKFKALRQKIESVKQLKVENIEKSESKRRQNKEELENHYNSNRAESYRIRKNKQEKIENILDKNREGYKTTKDRQKLDEFLMEAEYKKKIEDNYAIKNMIQRDKDLNFQEKVKKKKEKSLETHKMYLKRINDENEFLQRKFGEKEKMLDIDLALIECLQTGAFIV